MKMINTKKALEKYWDKQKPTKETRGPYEVEGENLPKLTKEERKEAARLTALARSKEWVVNNKERRAEWAREYYQKNRDRIRAQQRELFYKNKGFTQVPPPRVLQTPEERLFRKRAAQRLYYSRNKQRELAHKRAAQRADGIRRSKGGPHE